MSLMVTIISCKIHIRTYVFLCILRFKRKIRLIFTYLFHFIAEDIEFLVGITFI